jgi:Na+/melibiose symporter-like transporter
MTTPAQRIYYGWVIVAIGCGTMLFVQGSFASSGVLFAALTQEYGWSRATTSLPFSVALVGFVPHLAQMSLWFHQRRGLASGLVLSGASMGTLILVPGLQYVVNGYGWRLAYTVLGLLVLGLLIPLNALWQRHRPSDLGLYPDGAPAPPPAVAVPAAGSATTFWTLRGAMRTRRFWYLFVMATCVGWLSNIVNVHQISHMVSNGFPSLLAAEVVAMMGLMRAVGSTFWGGLADRFGREGIYTTGISVPFLVPWS